MDAARPARRHRVRPDWRTPTGPTRGPRPAVQVAFYDATNPEARELRLGKVRENYLRARHQGLLAGRLRAGAHARTTRRTCATTPGAGLRGRQLLPARARPHVLRRAAAPDGRRRGRCRSTARPGRAASATAPPLWSGDIGTDFADPAPPDRGRAQHRALRHPLVEHGHRRLPRRRPGRPGVPRGDGPLVPVRRLLPAVRLHGFREPGHAARPGDDRRPERGVVVRRGGTARSSSGYLRLRERLQAVRPATSCGRRTRRGCRRCGRCSSSSRRTRRPGRSTTRTCSDRTCWSRRCCTAGADQPARPICRRGRRGRTRGPVRRMRAVRP